MGYLPKTPSPNKIPFGEEALKTFFSAGDAGMIRENGDYLGDLFSHDYDALKPDKGGGENSQKYASSSGGIFFL
ncbi:hypothetical protein Ct9H90mP29_07220 [bacterium]|nr:MAG: hypothetical protein Ct9H90mP29_07220 [bacterium]